MSSNITLSRWFVREEIDLIKRCLEAIVSLRFLEDDELQTVTGWYLEEFHDLLGRFDTVTFEERALTQEDFGVIFQAVNTLTGYPIDRPRELETLLGLSLLQLKWFLYLLMPIQKEWDQHVQDDARQPRRASTLPT